MNEMNEKLQFYLFNLVKINIRGGYCIKGLELILTLFIYFNELKINSYYFAFHGNIKND